MAIGSFSRSEGCESDGGCIADSDAKGFTGRNHRHAGREGDTGGGSPDAGNEDCAATAGTQEHAISFLASTRVKKLVSVPPAVAGG